MKTYEIDPALQGIDALTLTERPDLVLEAGQVPVRMHAVSLNFRDVQILRGTYGEHPRIPLSDGAGEVIAAAPGVQVYTAGFFDGSVSGTGGRYGP